MKHASSLFVSACLLSLVGCTPEPDPRFTYGYLDTDMEPLWTTADIKINEVSSTRDWVELINLSSERLDIGGFGLRDGDPSHSVTTIPWGTILDPGGLAVVRRRIHGIGFGSLDGARLYDRDGRRIDSTDWPDGDARESWCRLPDGAGPFQVCEDDTPKESNEAAGEDPPDEKNPDDYPHVDTPEPLYYAGLDDWEEDDVEVKGPNELSFDAEGRLWAGDQSNLRVQVYDTDGSFLATLGGVGDGPGEFEDSSDSNRGPEAIKLGPDGIMYVVDRIGRRINRYDTATLTALSSLEVAGLEDPTGLAVSSDGRIFVADSEQNEIRVFDLDGDFLSVVQREHDGDTILRLPETLALDESRDRLYSTSEADERVQVYELSSEQYLDREISEKEGSRAPGRITDTIEGIIADPSRGLLFICDEEPGRFMIHDLDSSRLYSAAGDYGFLGSFGSNGDDEGEFDSPDGVALSLSRDLLAIADQGNDRIQVFSYSALLESLGLD